MTTMELKNRKMDLMKVLLQLDSEKFTRVEKYIRKLINEPKVERYEISANLLKSLLDQAEENKKKGNFIEEEEMNNFIDSLQ